MSKSMSTDLFWDDWYRDTDRLTYAEKGLWIDLIGRTVNSPKQGHYFTALQKLAGCGTCEAVWKLLMNLAVKGVADIYVEGESGEVDQKVTCENARKYATATVDDYTRVIVVCRRVVREAEARSREAERTAKRRAGSERHMPDRTRTETGQNPDITPDTDRTEPGHYPGQNPDRNRYLPSSTIFSLSSFGRYWSSGTIREEKAIREENREGFREYPPHGQDREMVRHARDNSVDR
jgi:hypothetical protein